ncbi:hypothetical protein GUITHDRAFT_156288 [Guillardia theta CCMP2712]|uniref:Uncharacterized protein n=2 Tax=Guillardia theta TaxID=55529 RepID=L1I8M8_GUITC|nr:hypothetical protein GUITHDRAFT_156288 [Guillardia theta CCMP2712]EKX32583.1 hypothetical protein GUITHDRAFT_156288 [Guillardia theta CCMP2712]|eukprot:XP_005819563.1 hypothetical protein GUITHDRAFT_156288 [Guillardia theta CCMP2712]
MPAMLAHQLVDAAISRGKSTVDNLKSKPGYLKWTVERVEQPVLYVADTNLAKAALKAGDHALTIADQTIDKAMNTHAYKSTHAFVKTTYSTKVQPVIEKRIVPATNAVSSGIATTTSTIVNAPAKTYEATMTFADRQVDYFLPEKDQQLDKDLKKSPVGITLKVSRRTGRRVIAVKNRVHKAASWVVDTARPSNVKRQATKTYSNIFSALDGFVDKYLPDDDKIVAKGPIVLTKKVMTRGKKRGLAAARSAMLAVKTSPQTFKRILSDTVKGAKLRISNTYIATCKSVNNFHQARIQPLVESAQTRALAVVKSTDSVLLKYPLTAKIRNVTVSQFEKHLAPLLGRLLSLNSAPSSKAIQQENRKSSADESKETPAPETSSASAKSKKSVDSDSSKEEADSKEDEE